MVTEVFLVERHEEENDPEGYEYTYVSYVFSTADEARRCAEMLNRTLASGVVLDDEGQFVEYIPDHKYDFEYFVVRSMDVMDYWETSAECEDFRRNYIDGR